MFFLCCVVGPRLRSRNFEADLDKTDLRFVVRRQGGGNLRTGFISGQVDGGRKSPYGGDGDGIWVHTNPDVGFWEGDEHHRGVHLARGRELGGFGLRERKV